MSQRYYDILGVNKDASLMEMKEAYERLCKEYEPSDHQFDPEYVKRYEEVQEAFDWLKNNHMWTINVEKEEDERVESKEQSDKDGRLFDFRYVLLAALLISSVVCYVFVSPYVGAGGNKRVDAEEITSERVVESLNTKADKLLSVDEFAELVKSKYPEYQNVDNAKLAARIIDKYPEYKDKVDLRQQDRNTEGGTKAGLNEGLEELYRYDGVLYSRQDLVNKYGERVEEAINKFGIQVVDKKSGITTPTQSPNTTTTLSHGGNPYGYCYTSSKSCSSRCSEIKVSASSRVGTIVIIKQEEEVVRCAYIDKGRTFTFKLPNGTYTPYFYSGTGWSNKKYMKTTTQCGRLYGGFTVGESVGKDTPQTLNNQILSYDLNTQYDGNFQTKSSDVSEAF